jgi:3-isopropylmalate/(R)-2-methylmalate dehydratase small subunit
MTKITHKQIQQQVQSMSAVLDIDNIDTDMIIPKQFLKTITRIGLGKYLFYEKRYNEDGSQNRDFILNKYPGNKSQILITGKNFGCGSSREHAPWALKDFGIKVVIAESFADIFYNNCFENQILPIAIDRNSVLELIKLQNQMEITNVDIEGQIIKCGNLQISFDIDKAKKYKIVHNLDQIGETLLKIDKITAFEQNVSHEFVF